MSIKWTQDLLSFARENIAHFTVPNLANIMSQKFGIDISLNALVGALARNGIMTGRDGRFRPGHIQVNPQPYKGTPRQVKNQFKSGSKPHNTLPVGSERITKDDIVQIKMTDTGYPPVDWVSKAKVIWEQHHGCTTPKGHIIRFADGNRRNFATDNLVCVSRSENAVINKLFRSGELHSAESLHTARLLAQLAIARSTKQREATTQGDFS